METSDFCLVLSSKIDIDIFLVIIATRFLLLFDTEDVTALYGFKRKTPDDAETRHNITKSITILVL
jgi:hypothetical protein